jgi:hypothetical protein
VNVTFGHAGDRDAAPIPEVEKEEQTGRAGEHEDPADHVQVDSSNGCVYGEGEDRADDNEKNSCSDTHTRGIPGREDLLTGLGLHI